jgi:hypothetical protein
MKRSPSTDSTAELIRSLPNLPKDRLLVLWQENFGKPAGRIRAELMIPVLAFRIQKKAYGGLNARGHHRPIARDHRLPGPEEPYSY